MKHLSRCLFLSAYQRVTSVFLLFAGCSFSLQAQSPACTNSSLAGTYFYLLNGSRITGNQAAPYAELGILVADGQGHVSGESKASIDGALGASSLTGTYAIQGGCRGSMTLTVNSSSTAPFNFEVVSGGESALLAFSSPGGVIAGRAYRVAAGSTQCEKGSFAGSYGFLLSGVAGSLLFSEEGQVVSDGNGNLNLSSTVNSNGAVVQVLGSGTYSLGSNCSGTASVTSELGNTNYLFAVVQKGQSVLFLQTDPATTVAGLAQSQPLVPSVLPDFVFGGGYYSAIYFTNTGDGAVSFPVNFISDNGSALTVSSVGGSSTNISLAPQGTALIEAPDVGPLMQGYASLFLPSGVVSYGIFRKSAPGIPDQEVIVPLSDASSTRRTLIWDDTNFVTAVAIVNPSSVRTEVTICVRDNAGNLIGNSTIFLNANSKTAVVMRDVPGLGSMAGKRGSADFSVTVGNVAVLGLRFSGSVFTSIPTVGR